MSALPDKGLHNLLPPAKSPLRQFPRIASPRNRRGRKAPARRVEATSDKTPEIDLLLACLRHHHDASRAAMPVPPQGIDWTQLMLLAGRHRVRPLLSVALSQRFADVAPPKLLEDLRYFTQANAQRNLFLTGALLELLDLLQSQGIEAAAFKGPVLAAATWRNPALRESGDLDLLVRRQDVVRTWRFLQQRGFMPIFPTSSPREAEYLQGLAGPRRDAYLQRHGEHHLLLPRGRVNIDLHSSIALREFWMLRRPDEAWGWLSEQSFAGRSVRGFDAEHTLLMLCINGAKDCWGRIDRVCDVAELLNKFPALDWAKVQAIARGIGAMRIVCLALHLSSELLGAPIANATAFTQDSKVHGLARQVRERWAMPTAADPEAPSLQRSLFQLRLREQWHDRLGYCLAHLEPTVGDWAALPLPDKLSFVHYLVRPFRLARKFAAIL